ncbi:MAG: GntR family transcriptional regulator [Microbacterium sp.]|uniref:GntR family transcriptional regulator n=1 Tax=Microbacterium sp. TaxID=51671 RepID=UPI0039E3A5C8
MSITASPLLAENVLLDLRGRILTGQLAPGEALSVPALARDLGVSRSPVRDAVQQLISEGVATHTPYAGARVARIDDGQLADAFAVRRELDGLAAGLAAGRISAGALAVLHTSLEMQRARLAATADEVEDRLADIAFHAAIRDAAGNPTLVGTLARLDTVTHLYRSAMWNDAANRRYAYDEHARIVDGLDRGDATAAREAAVAHVDGVLRRMLRRPE